MEKGTVTKVLGGLGLGYLIANAQKGTKIIFTCILIMGFVKCSGIKNTIDGAVNIMAESNKIKELEKEHLKAINKLQNDIKIASEKNKKELIEIKLLYESELEDEKTFLENRYNKQISLYESKELEDKVKINKLQEKIDKQDLEIRKLNLLISY